jgi:cell division cycle 14
MQCIFRCTTGEEDPDSSSYAPDGKSLIYLIPGKLAFMSSNVSGMQELKDSLQELDFTYVSSDIHRKYVPFALDFGPVNIAIIHRFCIAFAKQLASAKTLLIYTFENTYQTRSNSCLLLAAFMMLNQGWSLDKAAALFCSSNLPFPLVPFRDATFQKADFGLDLLDCLSGLARASELGWYEQKSFDLALYEELEDPLSGDLAEICPKFVAFKGPTSNASPESKSRQVVFSTSWYIPIFLSLGVTCVVRLNEAETYDRSAKTHAFG